MLSRNSPTDPNDELVIDYKAIYTMCGIFITLLGPAVEKLTFCFNLYQVLAESEYGQKETLEQFETHVRDKGLVVEHLDLAAVRDKIRKRGRDSIRVFRQEITKETVETKEVLDVEAEQGRVA